MRSNESISHNASDPAYPNTEMGRQTTAGTWHRFVSANCAHLGGILMMHFIKSFLHDAVS